MRRISLQVSKRWMIAFANSALFTMVLLTAACVPATEPVQTVLPQPTLVATAVVATTTPQPLPSNTNVPTTTPVVLPTATATVVAVATNEPLPSPEPTKVTSLRPWLPTEAEMVPRSDAKWWNDLYHYRLPVTLESAEPIGLANPRLSAVTLTVDMSEMVASGKAKPDFSDLQLIHDVNGVFTQLGHDLVDLGNYEVQLTFTLAAPLNNVDDNYWLYYGFPLGEHEIELKDYVLPQFRPLIDEYDGEGYSQILLEADRTLIYEGESVTFYSYLWHDEFAFTRPDEEERTTAEYLWTFGDGTTSTTPMTVTHAFTQPGSYTVTVRHTFSDGTQGLYGISDYIYVLADERARVNSSVGVEQVASQVVEAKPGEPLSITSRSGLVRVDFPADAFTQTLYIKLIPHWAAQRNTLASRYVLSAIDMEGNPVAQLAVPFEVTFDLKPYEFREGFIDYLFPWYWDLFAGKWVIAQGTTDAGNQQIVAIYFMFTDIGVGSFG